MCEPETWLVFFLARSKKSCAETAVGVDVCRFCSRSTCTLLFHLATLECLRGWLMSELGGPALAALQLPTEKPEEVEPMCACCESGFSGASLPLCE